MKKLLIKKNKLNFLKIFLLMNETLKDQKYYYQIKNIRKISENSLLKYQNERPKKDLTAQRKKSNILIPSSNTNDIKKINYFPSFNSNMSNHIVRKINSKIKMNNAIYQNLLKSNNTLEGKMLQQRPKIKIKLNSLKHNNINKNNISSEKINNEMKCKVYKISNNEKSFDKICNSSFNKNIKRKINYNIVNLNNDIFDKNNQNNEQTFKDKDLSFINYYNILQKKKLEDLSNNLENLIGNKIHSKSEHPGLNRNNENNNKVNSYYENKNSEKKIKNISNYKNKENNTNVYRKKIQRNKTYYVDTFPVSNCTTFEQNNILENINTSYNINTHFCNNLIPNKLASNRTYRFISKRSDYKNSNNESVNNNYNNKNSPILMTSYVSRKNTNSNLEANMNRNYQSDAKQRKEYINPENNNNSMLNNKANTINFLGIIKPEYKEVSYSYKKNNFSEIRNTNNFKINTPKSNNILIDCGNLEDEAHSNQDYSINLNYFTNNNENKINIDNNCITLYTNTSSQYNTVNTLNNSDKNIIKIPNRKEIDEIKVNTNESIMSNNNKKPINNYYNPQNKILVKNEIIKRRKNISSNNSNNKKLRNVITSIEYGNRNKKNMNNKDKNIILSEFDQNGKINIKVREMKNSIEKILRENSFNKVKNLNYSPSPKKWNENITYVKKNQGTHIKKIKKHNTINHIDQYPPPIPF